MNTTWTTLKASLVGWLGDATAKWSHMDDLVQSACSHPASDRGATRRKLEGGSGASSAKGEPFPQQSLEVPQNLDEETVLVDPHDDDGAAVSPGGETPEAAGATTETASAEAAATTEAADAKKLERLLYLRIAFRWGPPRSGTVSASGAAWMVRRGASKKCFPIV